MTQKKYGRYGEYLFSDQNIYHAIYSLRSYIFEFELLEEEDKKKYYRLQDKFDEVYIREVINLVRTRIIDLIDKQDCFIETRVYFRPKKINDEGEVVFRPLHTTDIISQIAIVSMLHLLVYEIPEQGKLYLSDVSRLIPGNFYGNRVSLHPEMLFKPWKRQYQVYTQNANEGIKKYHTSLEYKYEVSLDLKNFFPTIDPMLVYELIMQCLPVNMEEKDKQLMEKILIKLLFCKIENPLSDKLKLNYYKVKNQDIGFSIKSGFVRGIPQGLPQSYFLGNICMIPISEIFQKEFRGVSYFYVDDSVIFTNDVKEEKFYEQLNTINSYIECMEKEFIKKENEDLRPKDALVLKKEGLYGIRVHCVDQENTAGECKSTFTSLAQLDKSEVYLKCVSREVSQAGSEFYKMYSDEEDVILERRMGAISKEVKKKIGELDSKMEEMRKKDESSEEDSCSIQELRKQTEQMQSLSKFRDRWVRYYRFFEYRRQRLALRRMTEKNKNRSDQCEEDQMKFLEEIIYGSVRGESIEKKRKNFMQSYNENIWGVAVSMYYEYTDKKEQLLDYIKEVNNLCFGEDNTKSSYIYKQYEDIIKNHSNTDAIWNECRRLRMEYADPYRTLKFCASCKLKAFSHKHYQVAQSWVDGIHGENWKQEILEKILSKEMICTMEIVNHNTQQLLRMVANTVYSNLFDVEIGDRFVIRKSSRKALSCGEFRILLFLRNRLFTEESFLEQKILLSDLRNRNVLDYAVMEVVEIFRSFVEDPVRIDKLILTHQYTCEVWKNGSKHLYFYTLHNQEHAIALIRNLVKLVHGINFLKISSLDYYILFLACYLHDISMVKIPALDGFLTDREEGDEVAWKQIEEIRKKQKTECSSDKDKNQQMQNALYDISQIKKWMTDIYREIDTYYEKKIRRRHAADSAVEIRSREDLAYLDDTLREFVAEVSEAHQSDERDVYYIKSTAEDKLISLKFDKILLRLADLLDMSNCRISRPILYHNLDQMSDESAFHWISHLLIQGYELETEYRTNESRPCLTPKSIVEKLILSVTVDISQMSKFQCKKCCEKVMIDNISTKGFDLIFGKECENGDQVCNFLCRWFVKKNEYLIRELSALQEYLNRVPDNFFGSEIIVRVKIGNITSLDARQFDVLEHYLNL